MTKRVLAMNVDGKMTYCTCPPDMIGRGRCNHIAHQRPDESAVDFIKRMEEEQERIQSSEALSQQDVDELAAKLDEIAGCHLTAENLREVLSNLPPEKVDEIAKIGFNYASEFSLPISEGEYEQKNVENKLYFATLPQYGVAGSMSAFNQMFTAVGVTPVHGGKTVEIEHSYKEGLTPEEYFDKIYYARDAVIVKGVETSKPGYIARKLFYALSDSIVMHDCGGPHIDPLHCKLSGKHVCALCASKVAGGNVQEGQLVGGDISTRLSEGLTQLSMERKHTGSMDSIEKSDSAGIIMATLDGWGTSPIIQKMKECKTTEEMRQICFESLKEAYHGANIKQDDFNLMMVAKALTSFKRIPGGIRPVEEGERADIVSVGVLGNENNIFKSAQLGSGYKLLTVPREQKIHKDAANQIMN